MERNYFGHQKYPPIQIFKQQHQEVCDFALNQLTPLFKDYGKDPHETFQIIKAICNSSTNLERKEKKLNQFFEIDKQGGATSIKLLDRAEIIYNQIMPLIEKFANGKNTPVDIIDVGCGDGLVSHLLRTKAEENKLKIGKTYLADTHEYRNDAVLNNDEYPFIHLDEYYSSINTKEQKFDCVLLLTVLHHSENPIEIFRACCNVLKPNGIVVIIESCVGITEEFVKDTTSVLTGKSILEDNNQKTAVEKFLDLGENEQFLYGTFIDWFYNRVLHEGVMVPFNFNTPGNWDKTLSSIGNMEHLKTYCEGFDQITVPEFHTLHVFKFTE